MGPEFGSQNSCTQILEQTPLRNDVFNVRQIMQRDGFRAKHGRGHARQRGIFRATYGNATLERPPADNPKFIHDG